MSFHIDGTSVYLFGVASDVGLTGTSTEATIGELLDSMSPEQPKKKKHNINVVVSRILLFTMKLLALSCGVSHDVSPHDGDYFLDKDHQD